MFRPGSGWPQRLADACSCRAFLAHPHQNVCPPVAIPPLRCGEEQILAAEAANAAFHAHTRASCTSFTREFSRLQFGQIRFLVLDQELNFSPQRRHGMKHGTSVE